jgi:zinc protease
LVEKKEQAVTAFSFGLPSEDPGLAIAAAIGANGVDVKTLLASMDQEIELIQNELVSKEELEKVLNQYENDIVSTNSSVAGIAENLADNYMYRKNTSLINKQLDAYLSVTREDIQRVAKKYYTKNARVVLFYLPKSSN